jgi:phosphoenolpyruvate-protein kinase (PTS system EI component)
VRAGSRPEAGTVDEIAALPYVPGQACGLVSRSPQQAGTILVATSPVLPAGANPAGVAVVDAAPFSHPMLALLARGIPTVIVTAEQAAQLIDGHLVVLDGARGCVRDAVPGEPLVPAEPAAPAAGEPVMTRDGVAVALRASVRDAAGAAQARARGAEAIGLVRSEFLVSPDARTPDRGFYEKALAAIAQVADPLAVTVRLLDIATDKRPAWLPPDTNAGRPLGLQGVRLFAYEPARAVVDAQLDALGALAADWPLRLLLPYVTSPAEARHWRNRIVPRVPLPFGVMAETPAAALDIGALLEIADFVALGTNDLMQCLFGADRDQPAVRNCLDPCAPVLYRFLAEVAQAAGAGLARVQVCGLLSQLPGVLPVLLGLGYRAFSVDPVFLPWLAETVCATHTTETAMLAVKVCHAGDSARVRELLAVGGGSSRVPPVQPRFRS